MSIVTKSSVPRVVCLMVLACLALAWGPVVAAAPNKPATKTRDADRAEQLYLEGAALYRAGKYRQAVIKLKAAYSAYPVPNLLYNIGRCYEALGRVAEAIAHYQRCAADDKADPAARQKARSRAAVLAKIVADARAAAPERALPAKRALPKAVPSKVAPDADSNKAGQARALRPAAPKTRSSIPPEAERSVAGVFRSRSSKPAGIAPAKRTKGWALPFFKWTTAVLAVGLAGGGTAAFLLGKRDHDKVLDVMEEANGEIIPMTLAEARSLKSDGDTKKLFGYAMWGAAGAAFVLATILFIVDGDGAERSDQAKKAVTPGWAYLPGGGGVFSLRARF